MNRTFLILVATALVLSACASPLSAPSEPPAAFFESGGAGVPDAIESRALQDMKSVAPAQPEPFAPSSDFQQQTTQDRLVIQNADVSIVVADPKAKMDDIARMANAMGGFVVSSNMFQRTAPSGIDVPEASIVVRVPATRLDDALSQIKAGTVEVQSENRSGQDVTQQYVDLKSRLKNLEAAEAQLTRIMEQAQKTEDVLNVFNQLTYYREQIEVVKGQIKYFEEAAALSAISVRIIAEEQIKPLEIGGWRPVGVARDAVQALIRGLQGLSTAVIWVILYILPMLLLIALPFYLIFLGIRSVVRRRRKSKAALSKAE